MNSLIILIILIRRSRGGGRCREDGGDVVALEKDPPDPLPGPLLDVDLLCVVEDDVHVLVEPDDFPLQSEVNILVEPYLNSYFLYGHKLK